ncbi:Leucine-rich repeat-containing protein [Candidatus Megaera venefica]|uniref:Leucine-rich repeat-containing protein n=1 Tax=Candidatus Megaera venefica TaxID=2055910 RepID=A0ABU5NBR8_9RICK|nr:hypothetical protein [Candidatus Megaera venefica]MEA0970622.1 Leucine-rich repeat-containing protein [Candidatus Megaera venefica]
MSKNWVTIQPKSSYPTGGSHGGSGTQGGSYSTNGGSGGINTHGGSYAYGYDYAPGKHAYNISFKSIMDRTSSPAHGYLVPDKTINLRNNNLTDNEIAVLAGNLQYQRLDLDVFDVSNNKIGFGGVENLFYGLRFDNTLAGRYIVTMNFSNNLIGDDGSKYMADSLAMGRFPNLKSLDVSGNHITKTGTGYFIDALKNSTVGNIIIKQYHLSVFGNKENKIGFMKDYLKQAQDKGVDVNNIVVDKSLFGYIKNTGKVCKDTVVGFAKCYYVDDATTDYVANKIIARASKSLSVLWNAKDVVNCYAETFDDVMISTEGAQLIKTDLELIGESSVINAIE